MEALVVILVLGVFVGPSAYRLYERYKRRQRGKGVPDARPGPSYGRHMLGMLGPVLVLVAFLALLSLALYRLAH